MRIFSLLALLLSAPAFAINAPVTSATNVVGLGAMGATTANPSQVALSSIATVFSLYGGDSAIATGGNYYPLYKNGVAYQVTAGKTAYCFNISGNSPTSAVNFQLVSATAAFTFNQSTALTGGVFQSGAAGKYVFPLNVTASIPTLIPGTYQFGASTYVGFQAGNSQSYQIHLDCIEQ